MKSTEYYVVVAKAGGIRRICIEKKIMTKQVFE